MEVMHIFSRLCLKKYVHQNYKAMQRNAGVRGSDVWCEGDRRNTREGRRVVRAGRAREINGVGRRNEEASLE